MDVRKQITIKLKTSKRIDEYKLIEHESYDSVLTRILDEIDKDSNQGRNL